MRPNNFQQACQLAEMLEAKPVLIPEDISRFVVDPLVDQQHV
jgi:hypothetical protein